VCDSLVFFELRLVSIFVHILLMSVQYDYVAYIDESGDDGIKRVRPIDPNGASEWLILAAYLVGAHREPEVVHWRNEIRSRFTGHQRQDIHFNKLIPEKKLLLCETLAEKPGWCFAVASNKQNMKLYRNKRAEKVPSRNWFYCWMSRILIERVSWWVSAHSQNHFGQKRCVKLVYSNRGGMSYSQLNAYYTWLKDRTHRDIERFPGFQVDWDVISSDLIRVYPHEQRAGLQLADAVAGAVFKSCDYLNSGGIDNRFVKALKPRFAWYPLDREKRVAGFGLKLMPKYQDIPLVNQQRQVFEFFGYPEKVWWPPTT